MLISFNRVFEYEEKHHMNQVSKHIFSYESGLSIGFKSYHNKQIYIYTLILYSQNLCPIFSVSSICAVQVLLSRFCFMLVGLSAIRVSVPCSLGCWSGSTDYARRCGASFFLPLLDVSVSYLVVGPESGLCLAVRVSVSYLLGCVFVSCFGLHLAVRCFVLSSVARLSLFFRCWLSMFLSSGVSSSLVFFFLFFGFSS